MTRFVCCGCKIWRLLHDIYCQIVCNFIIQSVATTFSLLPIHENWHYALLSGYFQIKKEANLDWGKSTSVKKTKIVISIFIAILVENRDFRFNSIPALVSCSKIGGRMYQMSMSEVINVGRGGGASNNVGTGGGASNNVGTVGVGLPYWPRDNGHWASETIVRTMCD